MSLIVPGLEALSIPGHGVSPTGRICSTPDCIPAKVGAQLMVYGQQPQFPMMSPESEETDPFNLSRFVSAQQGVFERALAELRQGEKRSHWMWFIFPQLEGLGRSSTARQYAIRGLDEARAYLSHPVLGPRLLACCRALLSVQGKSASEIMGYPDDLKLRSSMTLFSLVADAQSEFREVNEKYYEGQQDPRTLELLKI